MRIGWLLGWAVPEEWFAPLACEALPGAAHTFAVPAPDALAKLEQSAPFDWVVGYSFGALLLLAEPDRAARLGRVRLLAPIFAFPHEERLGGRISRGELRLLSRRLRRDIPGALEGFYARAGLDVPSGAEAVRISQAAGKPPVDERLTRSATAPARATPICGLGEGPAPLDAGTREGDGLFWGLTQLETKRVEPPMPAGWKAWCGQEDALLDARRLHALDSAVTVLEGSTHHPLALIWALAEEVKA